MRMALLGCWLFCGALEARAQDKVTLQWKFSKGDKFRYEMTQTAEGTLGKTKVRQVFADGQVFEVVDVSDKSEATLKITWDWIRVEMSGGVESKYDSDKDKAEPEDPMSRALASLVGQFYTIKLTTLGEVTEVTGFEVILKKVLEKVGEHKEGLLGKQLRQRLDNEHVKKWITRYFAVLPKDPVTSGNTWDSELSGTVPMAGSCSLKNKLSLKELRDTGKEAIITQETKIKQTKNNGDDDTALTLEDTEAKTEIAWEISTGRIKSSVSVSMMKMKGNPQDMEVEVKVELRLTPEKKNREKKD